MTLLVKPNLKIFDSNNGLVLERRNGNVSLGFMTPRGLVQITYKNEQHVRIILNNFEQMLDRLDEDNTMPGPMEERIKRLRTKVAALSVKIDKSETVEPEFSVVLTFKGDEENVEYSTAPFKFLTQAIMAAEKAVREWKTNVTDKEAEEKANSTDAKLTE